MAAEPFILLLLHDHDDQHLTAPIIAELELPLACRFAAGPATLFDQLAEAEPALLLLDFNLKPQTGLELLAQIRSRPEWKHLPVVLLGDSRDSDFVRRAYAAGANSYIAKPTSLAGTRRVIAQFFDYWLQVAELPARRTEPKPQAS